MSNRVAISTIYPNSTYSIRAIDLKVVDKGWNNVEQNYVAKKVDFQEHCRDEQMHT